jgi:hypothetical protein
MVLLNFNCFLFFAFFKGMRSHLLVFARWEIVNSIGVVNCRDGKVVFEIK